MKILAVVGSPRKGGNTDLLMDSLIQGAREAGAEVERVFISDLDVNPCDNCDVCKSTGECIQEDDMTPLYDKLLESDVWVLGTPIYWWGPSAQLKAFIDRWYGIGDAQRQQLKGKKAALVAPFEDSDPATARHVVGMMHDIFDYLKMEYLGQVLATAKQRGEIAGNPAAIEEARALGRRIAAAN